MNLDADTVKRYGDLDASRLVIVPPGFDPEGLRRGPATRSAAVQTRSRLVEKPRRGRLPGERPRHRRLPMLGIAGIIVFFAMGLVVSMRLLGLWRSSRRLPELLAGLGLLGIGPLGYCVMMAGLILFAGTPFAPVFRVTGMGLQALGFVATAVFTWRVFRPGSRLACGLAAAISVSLLISFVLCALTPGRPGAMLLHHHLDAWLKIACLVWGALESLRYWRMTQQRVELGLADPLVSASFLAWGISLGAGALGFALIWAALFALAPGERLGAGVQLAISLCGITAASGLYLAFLPPKAYARRLAARASERTVVA
jgi:hypothetical protein